MAWFILTKAMAAMMTAMDGMDSMDGINGNGWCFFFEKQMDVATKRWQQQWMMM